MDSDLDVTSADQLKRSEDRTQAGSAALEMLQANEAL